MIVFLLLNVIDIISHSCSDVFGWYLKVLCPVCPVCRVCVYITSDQQQKRLMGIRKEKALNREGKLRPKENDEKQMLIRRSKILEAGYRLFSEKSIDQVSMQEVAKECGCGIATLYRYYNTKLLLVIAVGTWIWEKYLEKSMFSSQDELPLQLTAAELFEKYLDSFLNLYRNHSDILRFNQFFNVFVCGNDTTAEQMSPYLNIARKAEISFHRLYLKAKEDGTVRTDISEIEMFAETLHIMLAVTTRYAIGLVYVPENWKGAETELMQVKQMLMERYTRISGD